MTSTEPVDENDVEEVVASAPLRVPMAAIPLSAAVYVVMGGITAGLFGGEMDRPRALLLSQFVAAPAIVFGIFVILVRLGAAPWRTLGLTGRQMRHGLWVGFQLGFVAVPVMLLMNAGVQWWWPGEVTHPAIDLLGTGSWIDGVLVAIYAVVLAPVVEELFFRGVLQSALVELIGSWLGILFTGLAFGAAHWATWPDPVPLSFLGVGLGLAFLRTGTLWTSVFFHATFNGLMLLLALVGSP